MVCIHGIIYDIYIRSKWVSTIFFSLCALEQFLITRVDGLLSEEELVSHLVGP